MRAILSGILTGVIGVGLLPSGAFAHGGYYQGPRTPSGVPIPTSGPTTGGGLRGGPTTGGGGYGPAVTGRKGKKVREVTPSTTTLPPAFADPPVMATGWEQWWAFHREEFLRTEPGGARPLDVTPRQRDSGDGPPEGVREAAVRALIAASKEGSADVRASAALALARTDDERAVAVLRSMASDDAADDVRDVALLALGIVGGPIEVPFLHGVFSDASRSERARALAAIALGMVGDEDAVDLIAMTLTPGEKAAAKIPDEVMAAGLIGLGAGRRPTAVPVLRQALTNVRLHSLVRAHAATALGAVGDRGSLELLRRQVLNSREPLVRQSCVIALGRMLSVEDVEAINALLHVAKGDRDQTVQSFAALALGAIDGEAVRDQLLVLFASSSDNDKTWRALALGLQGDATVLPTLRSAFRADDHEESLQGAYAIAMAFLHDREARALLESEVSRHRRFWSPTYAAQALAMLGSRESADVIHARLDWATDPRQRAAMATALGILGDERSTKAMVQQLRGEDSIYLACTAAMVLGAARRTDALEELIKTAGDVDRNRYVRACAASAIGRILDSGDVPVLADLLAPQHYLSPLVSIAFARDMLDKR